MYSRCQNNAAIPYLKRLSDKSIFEIKPYIGAEEKQFGNTRSTWAFCEGTLSPNE